MLGLIFVNRSRSQNLWRAAAFAESRCLVGCWGGSSFLAAVIYIPQARAIFRFAELDWTDLMIDDWRGRPRRSLSGDCQARAARAAYIRTEVEADIQRAVGQCPRWSSLQGGRGGLPLTHCLFFLKRQRPLGYIQSARGW